MDINAIEMAGLVTRNIDTVERDGKQARLMTAERTYPTSIEDLWDAVTNSERLPRWFLPVSGELQAGGRYQLEGNASGEIVECDPPRRFEITWEFGGNTSWVTVELSDGPDEGEAHLRLEHLAHVPDELWEQYGPGATGVGWDLALMGLHLHLSGSGDLDPDEVRRWEGSPNAQSFIARTSAAWAEASIAAGTDPETAHSSAERVTEFYTAGDE